MTIKNATATFILALLFISLVAIYLVTSQDRLVTGLSVIIMGISLVFAISGGWREIGVIAVFAALVSLVAANLAGQARFGHVGGILFPVIWGAILLVVFGWISRNILRVPEGQAVLILNTFTGAPPYPAASPISPPILPLVERKYATIPLYELESNVSVKNINTKTGHNIDEVKSRISYEVVAPVSVLKGIPNRGEAEATVAKELGQDLARARTNIAFWERLLDRQMKEDTELCIREVFFAFSPVDAYKERDKPKQQLQERLSMYAQRWGVEINEVDLEHFDVSQERFNAANMPIKIENENKMEQIKAEREARRIKITSQATSEAEAERVRLLVQALQTSGIKLSAQDLEDIVITAIRASMELDGDYARMLPELPPPAKPAGEKKDDASKK